MVKSKKQQKEMPYNKNQIAIITSNVVKPRIHLPCRDVLYNPSMISGDAEN